MLLQDVRALRKEWALLPPGLDTDQQGLASTTLELGRPIVSNGPRSDDRPGLVSSHTVAMPKRAIRAILFDFDGTLVDASRAIIQAFNGTLQKRGLPAVSEDQIRSRIGRPLTEMFSQLGGLEDPEGIEQLIAEYRQRFLPISVALSRPLPGVRRIVRHFSGNMPMAVATSRHSSGALRILEGLGMLPHFAAVIGLDHVRNAKPHPEALFLALKRIRVAPEEAMMVGDTVTDIEAGRRGGLLTVGVTTGPSSAKQLREAGAEAVLNRMTGLIRIVESVGRLGELPPMGREE